MNPSFKALSALLTYPTPELVAALPEIHAALDAERGLPADARQALGALCEELWGADPLDAQERYVELFDRGRATSLNLFEHVHGDSRDRGQAMVDLKSLYERSGLALAGRELPDYLPALLEFLSLQPFDAAKEVLADAARVMRKLGEALAGHGSRYAAVPAALLVLAGERPLAAPSRPPEEKPLDLDWAEPPVLFGPGSASAACGAASAEPSVIRFMPRPHPVGPGVPR